MASSVHLRTSKTKGLLAGLLTYIKSRSPNINRVFLASNMCKVVPDMGRETTWPEHHFKDSPSCVFAFKSIFSEGKESDLLRLLQAISGIRCSLLASLRRMNDLNVHAT